MPASKTAQPTASPRILTGAAHAAFVPIGITTVLLGPMLPWLSARWSLDYGQAGSLFTAQFTASTLGVVVSGFLVARRGFRFAINAGLVTMALGLAVLPHGSRLVGWICVASYGFGLGLSVPAANLLVAEVNPARRSAALNLLNFSWSVGAVACPFLVAEAIERQAMILFLGLVAGCMLLVAVGIAATSSFIVDSTTAVVHGVKKARRAMDWNERSLLVLCVLFFLYVGTENAVGGWVASYAKSLRNAPSALAVMTPSFFYATLMIGRWLAPLLLRTIEDIKIARAGILLACGGIGGLVSTGTLHGIMFSAAIAGLGLSTVYPITISLLARQFGAAAARVGSVMFAMGNLGGACLPWLVGYCSTRFGALKTGLMVPLAAGTLMLVLYLANWQPSTNPPGAEIPESAARGS
jgi:MFS transporter, FHS family, glucose/mannose:H+ symporter